MRSAGTKWLIAVVVLYLAGLLAVNWARTPRCIPIHGTGVLNFPLSGLARGEAKLYCYTDQAGDRIRFILARDNSGKVHSVFDACSQCYNYHEGYRLTQNGLVCRLCGTRYSIGHMMKGKASCVPVHIPHKEVGGMVEIRTADIRGGRKLF